MAFSMGVDDDIAKQYLFQLEHGNILSIISSDCNRAKSEGKIAKLEFYGYTCTVVFDNDNPRSTNHKDSYCSERSERSQRCQLVVKLTNDTRRNIIKSLKLICI
jgi:hypothetical protein